MNRFQTILLLAASMVLSNLVQAQEHWTTPLNVVWDAPGGSANNSMPIGNGDVGANVWVEPNGDLLLLLAKNDAWDINGLLMKLGRIRIHITGDSGNGFRQELHLADGEIRIRRGNADIRIRIHAQMPVVEVDIDGESPLSATASLETWRDAPREKGTRTADGRTTGLDFSDLYATFNGEAHKPVIIAPDTVATGFAGQVRWFHHNVRQDPDPYEDILRLQGLGDFIGQQAHPLRDRIWGGAMTAQGWRSVDAKSISSTTPATAHRLRIHVLSQHPGTPDGWHATLDRAIDNATDTAAHARWWHAFWDRSWIIPSTSGPEAAPLQRLAQAHALQRYMNACASRGAFPIKFNGSLFCVGRPEDPDRRLWGPNYWFQNNRLVYWPMLADGDHDLMQPFFRMYRDMLPLLLHRTQVHFRHGGAYLSETMPFWGGQTGADYGWTPFAERTDPLGTNPFIKYYWQGGIELVLMMIEADHYRPDARFRRETLLPMSDAVLDFFRLHYPPGADGRLRIAPSQSLETWHAAADPAPEIIGLRTVLARLLAMDPAETGVDRRTAWSALLSALPPVPVGLLRDHRDQVVKAGVQLKDQPYRDGSPSPLQRWNAQLARDHGTRVLLPAAAGSYGGMANQENPELYAIFPYRHFGLGKPDLELARTTFAMRFNTWWQDQGWGVKCWMQDDIQAALLGEVDLVKNWVVARAAEDRHKASRFPAFYDAWPDECPDVDHAGAMTLALQFMLMQCDGDRIVLRPCWPREWNCRFKLHAPKETVVEGEIRDGQLRIERVMPVSRRKYVSDGGL